jgi:hypothetical protein
MPNRNRNKKPLASAISAANFAGFDDWFAIFEGGEQTDSKGSTKNWTHADLDSVVANHDAEESAPFVIGHTTDKSPAWGWIAELKREGDTLFAKGRDVIAEFEALVKNKQFPKRSIGLKADGNGGYVLDHLAWLGAKAPAVKGLGHIYSAGDDVSCFEFSYADDIHPIKSVLRSIKELISGFREKIIEKDGIEEADKVLPKWEVDHIDRQIDRIGEDSDNPLYQSPEDQSIEHSTFNEDVTVEPTEKEKQLQGQLDQAKAETAALKKAEADNAFTARKDKAQADIQQMLTDGKLLPANTQGNGLANFWAGLSDDNNNTFEFAATDGAKPTQVTLRQFFSQFLEGLGVQVETGHRKNDEPADEQHSYSAPDGSRVAPDRLSLHESIKEYQASHDGVDYETAAIAVERGEK